MNEENLINYYNKFNEDKRLTRRHGIVEFETAMRYINYYLKDNSKILDVGAGTGRYSIKLAENYDVTAVELVKHNLRVIQEKSKKVKSYLGNALDLSKFDDKSFDLVLLFGPMYHLISKEDKIKALKEARRVLKDDGIVMVSYYMNDYAIIKHGFIDGYIVESVNDGSIDNEFRIKSKDSDLYSYVRLEDIDEFNKICNLERIKIVAQDGASDYIRSSLNKMSDEEFYLYLKYHFSICERKDMLGCSSHLLDIVKKSKI